MEICPLCSNQVEKLHKRSHLLPEWMYRDVYNERHKFVNVDLANQCLIKGQKGINDEIICSTCETQSQQFDHYASLLLTNRSPTSIEYSSVIRDFHERILNGEVSNYSHWKKIDFHKFQKFIFICILRSHFSDLKKGRPLLVEKHFANIKSLYRSDRLVDDKSYPIIARSYLNSNGLEHIVIPPFSNKIDGHFFIEFAGGSYNFVVSVSSHKRPEYVENLRLMADGSMYIVHDYMENTGTFRTSNSSVKNIANKFPDFEI